MIVFSKPLLIVIAILAIAAVVKLVMSSAQRSTAVRYKRADLFNSSEHAFLLALRKAAPAHIVVLAKIRVADLALPVGRDIVAFNRIAKKHVDFVLYHAQTRQVLAAIELDGPTHASARAQASDKFKNSCFASAQLRLVRVPVANAERVVHALFAELNVAETDKSPMLVSQKAKPPGDSADDAGAERWQRPNRTKESSAQEDRPKPIRSDVAIETQSTNRNPARAK